MICVVRVQDLGAGEDLSQTIEDNRIKLSKKDDEIAQAEERLAELSDKYDQAQDEVRRTRKSQADWEHSVRELEEEKNSRGILGRLRHGKEDETVLEDAKQWPESVTEDHERATAHCDELAVTVQQALDDLSKLRDGRREIQGHIERDRSLEFLESLGMSWRADKRSAAQLRQHLKNDDQADASYEQDQ